MDDSALDALIDAGTTALGIEMKPEWRQRSGCIWRFPSVMRRLFWSATARPSGSRAGVSRMNGFTSATEIAAAVASGQQQRHGSRSGLPGQDRTAEPGAERIYRRAGRPCARQSRRDRCLRNKSGPLAGVPFAVKNLIDIAGLPTVAGSKINRDHPPASADAPLIARLEAAGAILVGALNMGEYAYDFTGENVHDGPSRNPFDTTRMSGGSSGGSGSAVGGGLVPLALGSDTNGSIRVPASFCGLFGLKPTYGRLTRAGSFPFVSSLDHLGPLARSAADLAMAYDAMQGYDPADPACVDRPAEPVSGPLDRGIGGLRIASAGGYFRAGASAGSTGSTG